MVREPFGKMSPEGQRGCTEAASIAPIVHQTSIHLAHTQIHTHTDVRGRTLTLLSLILHVTPRHAHTHTTAVAHLRTEDGDDMTVSGSCEPLFVCSVIALRGG